MTRSSDPRWAALVGATLFLASSAALGAPSAADVESARALYVTGKELREAGDLTGSLEKLRAAHALVPTAITTLELGRALALLGKPVEARQLLAAIDRLPAAEESKKAAAARVEAQELAGHLGQLIPSLTVEIAQRADASLEVSIDGERVPPEALGTARRLNPGKHRIVARAGSQERTEDVTLAEREERTLRLDLHGEGPPTRPPGAAAAALDRGSPRTALPWATVAAVVAGTTAAVGTVTGAIAWSKSGDLEAACPAERCPPPAHDDLSLVRATTTTSTIAFIVAAVAGAASLTLWLTRSAR